MDYWEKMENNIAFGLCYYFKNSHGIPKIELYLDEMVLFNPEPKHFGYYFPIGEIEPRIKLLKKCIKLVKTKL
jgi:hypothetical protein